MEYTDNDLLRRYSEEGSQEAFADLVARRVNLVHSAAMRQMGGDFHRAREVTQSVFIKLARKARSLSNHPTVLAWLYTAVFYEASAMRRAERRHQSKFRETTPMTDIVNPEPMCDWSKLSTVLDGAMIELGAVDREVVLWRFFEEESLAAIGGKLGVSEDTARKRVKRAVERMRRSLRRQGLDSTTATLAAILAENAVVAAPAGLAESVAAKSLAATAAGGMSPGGLRSLLGKCGAALRVPAVLWTSGIFSVGVTLGAAFELSTAQRAQASLSTDERACQGDQAQLRTEGIAFAKHSRGTPAPLRSASIARHGSRADFQAFLRDYPQSKELLLDSDRVLARQLYGAFFRNAALSPALIKKTEDALAEYWIQSEVLSPQQFALSGKNIPPKDQLLPILGDKAYRQFQDYQQSAFAHHWAAQVARRVPGELALSADQVDQLAQVIDGAAGRALDDQADLAALDWNAIRAQVEARLPAGQWDALALSLEGMRTASVTRSVWLSVLNSNP